MREPVEITDDAEARPKLNLVRHPQGFDAKAFARARWRELTVGLTLLLGIAIVLLGWYGAAHTNIVSEQIPYLISGGLLGLGLIIVAGFMAYSFMNTQQSEDFRREIVDAMGGRALTAGAGGGAGAGTPGASGAQPSGGTVYIVPGGKGYHLPGCPIVEGKQGVRELRLIQAIDGGYASCKLCSPD